MARPTAAPAIVAVDDSRVHCASRQAGRPARMRRRVVTRHARDRPARGQLRRGRSHRDAVRPRHGAAVGAGARRAQEPAPVRRRPRAVRGRDRRRCASAPGAELLTLERFDATDSHAALGSDVARMAHAAYAAELVGKLCAPRQVETGGLRLAVAFPAAASTVTAPAPSGCACSSSGCSSGLGFGPVLDSCAVCGARTSRAGRRPRWPSAGTRPGRRGLHGLRARRPPACSAAVRAALVRLSPRRRSPRRRRQTLPADVNRDCREALLEIINHHVSGPLKTVEFIAKVARGRGAGRDPPAAARHPTRRALRRAISRRPSGSGSTSWATRSSGGPIPTTSTCTAAATTWRLHAQGGARRRPPRPHRHRRRRARRRRRLGGAPGSARRRAEGGAQDPPRRLALALLPRPGRAAHPDHPPLADGRLIVVIGT